MPFGTNSTKLGYNLYPELEAYIDHNYVCEKRLEEYGFPYAVSQKPDMDGFAQYKKERDKLERNLKNRMEGIFGIQFTTPEKSKNLKIKNANISFEPLANDYKLEELKAEDYEEAENALEERMQHLSDTFQEYLFYIIEKKHMSNAEVYGKALISKQTFSKIKLNKAYHPDKFTAMRFCVALTLNLDESKDLLARAGYALSPSDKRDIIFSFFIEREIYDIYEIDIALEKYGLQCSIN